MLYTHMLYINYMLYVLLIYVIGGYVYMLYIRECMLYVLYMLYILHMLYVYTLYFLPVLYVYMYICIQLRIRTCMLARRYYDVWMDVCIYVGVYPYM